MHFVIKSLFGIIFLCLSSINTLLASIELSLSSQLCDQEEIQILVDTDASISSFTWTGPGLVDGTQLNPFVGQAGNYTLTIISVGSNIPQTATIEVVDKPLPIFNLMSSNIITCTDKKSTLTTDILQQDQFTYVWRHENGAELGDEAQLETVLGGIHFLDITNDLGCVKTQSVNVLKEIPPHSATVTLDSLTCDEVGQLFVSSTDNISNVSWKGPLNYTSDQINPMISRVGTYVAQITFDDNCTIDRTIKADYFDYAPDIQFTDPVINCDSSEVQLAMNTNPNYSYQWIWLNGAYSSTEAEPRVDKRGNYEVRVLDQVGCEAIYVVNVLLDTIPARFDIGFDELDCDTDSTLLSYDYNTNFFRSYVWQGPGIDNTNDTLAFPKIAQEGAYEISGKTDNGCPFQENVVVTLDLEPINITNTNTGDIEIDCLSNLQGIKAQTDRLPETFEWRLNGNVKGTADTLTVEETGSYTLTVTGSNGCTDQTVYSVVGDLAKPIVNNMSSTLINCIDTTASINIEILDANGGNDFTYTWYDQNSNETGETALNFATSDEGVYILESINNDNGCSKLDTFEVTKDIALPLIAFEMDTINCLKDSATVRITSDTMGLMFNWESALDRADGIANFTTRSTDPIYLESMGANGCIRKDTIQIIEDKTPPLVSFDIEETIGCIINALPISSQVSSHTFTNYEWTTIEGEIINGKNDQTVTIDAPGVYYLNAKDTRNQCTTKDSILVEVENSAIANVMLDTFDPLCNNDSDGMLDILNVEGANGALNYSLNNGTPQADPEFDNLTAGTYNLQLIDATGCTFDTIVTLVPGNIIEVMTIDAVSVDEGDTLALSIIVDQSGNELFVDWRSPDILPCDNCTEAFIAPYESQLVNVIVSDENGCTDAVNINVNVNDLSDIWAANIFSPQAENPTNRSVELYTASFVKSIINYSIHDRWGNVLYSESNVDPKTKTISWNGINNGKTLNTGVYILSVEYEVLTGERRHYKRDISFLN